MDEVQRRATAEYRDSATSKSYAMKSAMRRLTSIVQTPMHPALEMQVNVLTSLGGGNMARLNKRPQIANQPFEAVMRAYEAAAQEQTAKKAGDKYRFPMALKEAWSRCFLDEAPTKRTFRVRQMEAFCASIFGSCDVGVTESVIAVLRESLGATAAEVVGLDLQRGLAILMMVEDEDEKRLQLAREKEQQSTSQPQPQAEDPRVASLSAMLQQVCSVVEQQKVAIATLQAQLGIPAGVDGPGPQVGYPARYSLKDVREWSEIAAADPHGLVRDLQSEYVAGNVSAPGGAALKGAFERLRTWILGVAAGSAGWTANEELVRLGNELLLEVRLHHGWCVEKVPRGRMLREMETAAEDVLDRTMAKVKGDMEKERSRTAKWDAAPRRYKGGKGGKNWSYARGNVLRRSILASGILPLPGFRRVSLEEETESVLAAVRSVIPGAQSIQALAPSPRSARTNSSPFRGFSAGEAGLLTQQSRAASIVGQAVLDLVASKTGVAVTRTLASRHRERDVTVSEARDRLHQVVGRAWAESTVDDRRNLWRRFQAWTSAQGMGLNPDTAVLFVMATSVEPQGMLAYSRLLAAVFGHLGVNSQPLKTLASALRGAGAAIPLSQAESIPRDTLLSWAMDQVSHVRLATLVAWKTASRWADVCMLTRRDFVLVTDDEVIVDWGVRPKGRTRNPFCVSKLVVICGPLTNVIAMLVRGAGDFRQLTSVSTAQLARMWAGELRMCRYSAHSIKRGAVDHLLEAKSLGAPFPEHLISRVAKHKNEVDPTVAQMTVRYANNVVALARVLRTAEVTRFILWTFEANNAIEADGYKASVPLEHVSKYLSAVHAECGSTRDFRCGFYGVAIPHSARGSFRFRDDADEWWELTRLPMGHTCAPELMHTLTSTVAGHPDFVKQEHAVPSTLTVHTWVDNIRYAGSRKEVLEATRIVDDLAAQAKVTWKQADTRTASSRYEFIGVDWDHSKNKVGISAKLAKKLARDVEEVRTGAMSASGLETLGGRLLHASAIVGVFVGEYYFALKFLRRLTNALNRGEKAVDQTIRLSGGVQRLLEMWIRAVLGSRSMPVEARVPALTVFVDASLDGWGGVVVNVATNAIEVLGSRWSRKEKRLHINELEALAFERCVASVTSAHEGGAVTVVVDNTTVQGVARKGSCLRSQVLNDAVVKGLAHLRGLNISVSVRWVKSAGNPADLPSRVPVSALTDANLADMALAMLKVLEPISGDLREIKQVREKRSQRRERKMEALKDLWAREASRLDAEAFGDVQRNEQWKAAVQQQVGERERQLLREVDPGREPMPPVLWHTPDGKVPMARLAERQRETEDFERYMQRVEAGENVEWAPASPDLKRIKHPGRTVAPGYEPLPANGSRASPSYGPRASSDPQQQQRHVSFSPDAGSPRHVSEHDSRDAKLLLAAMRHADSMPLSF
ncbi:hypothetical protein DIPPA_32360 [Diplonema papillatum]|nr:hypothetical protein DIPPA_32360 [Diplonema papillatum]